MKNRIIENTERSHKEAVERAARLLDALLDPFISEGLKRKIRRWLRSEQGADARFDAFRSMFDSLKPNMAPDNYEYRRFEELVNAMGPAQEPAGKTQVRPAAARRTDLKRYAMRTAAVLIPAFIAGAAYLWVVAKQIKEQYPAANVSVSVQENGQKRIVLPDGSQVWLHSSGNLSYNDDFSQTRFITLDGEAFFSVVSDSGRPFLVKTDKFTVQVLGTEFNILSHDGAPLSEVILTRGSVMVTTSAKRTFTLTPDQRLTLDNVTLRASVDMINGDTVSMWRVRDLRFVDTPMDEAIEKIGIYYGLDVSMPGWKPTEDLINLDFDHELPIEYVLDAVHSITGHFKYRVTDNELIVQQTI